MVTNLANEIGRRTGVRCDYTFDSVKRKFVWKFYRRNRYIGSTSKPEKVVTMMTNYASTQ